MENKTIKIPPLNVHPDVSGIYSPKTYIQKWWLFQKQGPDKINEIAKIKQKSRSNNSVTPQITTSPQKRGKATKL